MFSNNAVRCIRCFFVQVSQDVFIWDIEEEDFAQFLGVTFKAGMHWVGSAQGNHRIAAGEFQEFVRFCF